MHLTDSTVAIFSFALYSASVCERRPLRSRLSYSARRVWFSWVTLQVAVRICLAALVRGVYNVRLHFFFVCETGEKFLILFSGVLYITGDVILPLVWYPYSVASYVAGRIMPLKC